MKKTTALVLVIVLLLSLVCLQSCGKSDGDPLLSFKMSRVKTWLAKTDADDVVRMEEFKSVNGLSPGARVTCYYTESTEIIEAYLNYYANARVTVKLFPEFVFGGGSTSIVFTFADGSTKTLTNSTNGYSNGLFYLVPHGSTKVRYEGEKDVFYRFNAYSDEDVEIYTYGENSRLIGESDVDASDLYFIKYDGDVAEGAEPTHFLETDFGRVYIYSDTLCYIDELTDPSDPDVVGFYELYQMTFSEIIK